MKITYNPMIDVVRIVLRETSIAESDENQPGVILDYDELGNIVGLEIIDASKRMDNPASLEYAVAQHP